MRGSAPISYKGGQPQAFDTRHPAWETGPGGKAIERAAFYQIREHWLDEALWPVMPEITTHWPGRAPVTFSPL